MLFSIPDSFISICFCHEKILFNKSRYAAFQELHNFLKRPVSAQSLLSSLRAGGYLSIVVLILILVLVSTYAAFRALYNYDIDFFLITLIEEKSLFCRIYGGGIVVFGFLVSIDFLY